MSLLGLACLGSIVVGLSLKVWVKVIIIILSVLINSAKNIIISDSRCPEQVIQCQWSLQ
jgi:hypothetical protein